jgi:spore coat protein U-like protein
MVKRIILIIAIAMIAFSGVAVAGDTTTVAVSATVSGTCKFNNSGSVTFALDQAVGGDKVGIVVQPQFWCTKNTLYTISDTDGDNGIHNMKHSSDADLIAYSFTYTASGTGSGPTTLIPMNIASTVVEADYINVASGSYSDTVVLTIAP